MDVPFSRRPSFPFWTVSVNRESIDEIIETCKGNKIILAHETLGHLCKHISPDVFIFHNLFSNLLSPFPFLNFYFKFGALRFEKYISRKSQKCAVVGFRENSHFRKINQQ